ncbi:Electron transporter, partial [Zea mays]
MEVEALEKKGHAAFAKAMKSFGSSERYKRSTSGRYFEDMYATDALRSSDKTIVLPMP